MTLAAVIAAITGLAALVTTFLAGRRAGRKVAHQETHEAIIRNEQRYRAWRVRSEDELVKQITAETQSANERLANPPKTEAEALAEIAAAKARR